MDNKDREETMRQLDEKAWQELIDEGLVYKEGDNYIWSSRGKIECWKIRLMWDNSIGMSERVRTKKH